MSGPPAVEVDLRRDADPKGSDAEQPLDPRARRLWSIYGGVSGAFIGVVTAFGLAFVGNPWPLAVMLVPGLAAAAAWYARLHWERWRWAITTEALELRHGVVRHKASYVPFHRIQQIDVERGPADRAFGLARLVVHTASATTDASLPGLAQDVARSLRRNLVEQASLDDGV